ncbi:putative acyl-CoA transferase/carnitine dehydratase [Pseudarthrobacter phenanthrenivorans Sphe3]|uniref:Putative acyl-CoA transferase/carnitine dehydratase n=1 Tax=Pseudarthrobacter phenanthrenivorans (strain DSM 18606 / JCM 16027 / LMG 23796 / Sphe3) TaxID=930171 RepID=F0M4L1_PSEPM|nr:CoA transferase [Pseudarthrobacter phenanthrenivorans]ADX74558.1 putative acyl-CoA transferase/carnitine dehydratase [Pseudarthrobacter phenanthrenivorans Sphe3]
MERQALAGMRVIDLTQVMAGPFCTMLLADIGADVIKVEPPGGGDQTRHSWGRSGKGTDGPAFFALNRNKRSVVLDLRSDDGRKDFRTLVKDADVVIENFRPGVAARLGIDYETLKEINPGLIYASISGFGQSGPYSARPGYDLIAQGMSGVMSVTGQPGEAPAKAGVPVADLGSGLFCLYGILAAYVHKLKTGEGQQLEASLFESAVALSVWEATEYWASGEVPARTGSAHRMSAPYQAFKTGDGWMTIGANNQRLWGFLCESLGHPELADDERFATNPQRMHNRDLLAKTIEEILAHHGTDYWVERLLAGGVPAGPILNYDQVLNDPHVIDRNMVQTIPHPVEGEVKTLGFPVKFYGTPARTRLHPPLIGEHQHQVFGDGK